MNHLNKKEVIILICIGIALLIIGIFIGKHLYKCKPIPVDTHAYDNIINQRDKLIDSVERSNMQLGLSIQTRDSLILELQQTRNNITNESNKVYEQIDNANDSMQRIIRCQLLTGLRHYAERR